MSSSETHFFASQRHGAAALKPRLHWKSFLGEKTVRSSPSRWNQNLSNEAITSVPGSLQALIQTEWRPGFLVDDFRSRALCGED